MTKVLLLKKLREWVKDKEANGVIQHSVDWERKKVFTIGGSSLATIQGKNPYSNVYKMLGEKIGIFKFVSDIKPQWGNLFEDVIKRYVERDRECEVLGEDLFVEGADAATSYSPDGLAVMDIVDEIMVEEETVVDTPSGKQRRVEMVVRAVPRTAIVLVEFKCPYSRIPSGSAPEYYVPQVKMGLDLLDLPSVGLFVEGVFRRCTWEQLGNNASFDRLLVPKSSGKLPLAYGIIGFYIDAGAFGSYLDNLRRDPHKVTPDELIEKKHSLLANYVDHYVEYGCADNDFMCNDLGDAPPELFKQIMDAYDKGIVTPWYGDIAFVDTNMVSNNGKASPEGAASKLTQMGIDAPTYTDDSGAAVVNADMARYTAFARDGKYLNLGVLPWKLFRVDYDYIQREDNYIAPWLPKIREIIGVVRSCLDPKNAGIKSNLFNSYINRATEGFSDQ